MRIAAPAPDTRIPLPAWLRVARAAAIGLALGILGTFVTSGTIEGRVLYLFIFALGWLHPAWGMYGIALTAGFYLVDPGKTHLLRGLEVFVLGILCGELRLLDRPAVLWPAEDGGPPPKADWGAWPHYAAGLALLLLAAGVPSLLTLLFIEDGAGPQFAREGARLIGDGFGRPDIVAFRTAMVFGDAASGAYFPAKALWDWLTGLALCIVAARHATPVRVARWLKLAAIGATVYGAASLLHYCGLLSLDAIRRDTTDPLQHGRLQGVAGHPGWLAEWLVLAAPGLVLWFRGADWKRWAIIAGALAIHALCLFLAASRGAWLGAAAAVAFWLCVSSRSQATAAFARRAAPAAILAVAAFIAIRIGGVAVTGRMENLLNTSDRVNYYRTAFTLLREHPLGLGLGLHSIHYSAWFTPLVSGWQFDHVTTHSTPLELLVEIGPFGLFAIIGGLGALALASRGAWRVLGEEERPLFAALWMALVGMGVLGVAHYVFYIRVTQVALFMLAGFCVGTAARSGFASRRRIPGAWVLAAFGSAALLVAAVNARRDYVEERLRGWDYELPSGWVRNPDDPFQSLADARPWHESHSVWTARRWRTAIDPDATRVSFVLERKEYAGQVTITWPDGARESFSMREGEKHPVARDLSPVGKPGTFSLPRWLVIEVVPTFTPRRFRWDVDERALGVYVRELQLRR